MSKLALGTAQFGMNYGIGSTSGKVEIGQVQEILKYAKLANIDMLDTAPSYGNSEKILGEVNVVDLKVVSKTRHIKNLKITDEDLLSLNHDFETSLIDLKLDSIYGLLIHNTDDLIKPGASKIIKFLENLKKVKKIEKTAANAVSLCLHKFFKPSDNKKMILSIRISLLYHFESQLFYGHVL